MSVLAPFFLAGLGALLVPLLVHLVHKERKDTQAFPSFMFLKRTPYPFSARQRIRDWWLFALRSLLIALAAFAFARPVFARRAAATSALDQGQEVVVLLDRSFSMRYGDRWAAAKREVNAVIGKLSARDRMTLVAFDRRAMAVNEPTGDAGALRAALDTIVLTDEGTRLAPAIAVGRNVLGASALPRKRLVVISDFQRTSWDLTDELQLPLGTDVTPVDVGGATPVVDHAVRSTDIRRDPSGDGSRVFVSARLVNVGPAVRQLGVRLLVGGRTVDTKKVDLPRDVVRCQVRGQHIRVVRVEHEGRDDRVQPVRDSVGVGVQFVEGDGAVIGGAGGVDAPARGVDRHLRRVLVRHPREVRSDVVG